MDPGGWTIGAGPDERTRLSRNSFARGWARFAGHDPRLLAVAVVGSICVVYRLPTPPAPVLFIPPLALCLLRFPGRTLVAVALIAAVWASLDAHARLDTRLPASQDGDIRWVTGTVTGLPVRDAMRTRFVLEREQSPQRMRLSWYDDAPRLWPGDCVRVRAKLDTPHGSANPGTFDYEAWLWRQRVDAAGYVKQAGDCDRDPRYSVDRLRAFARQRLDAVLADAPMRGMIEALTIGARDAISDEQWRVLRATGTSHLVAISGLHIGLIAAWLFMLARWLALRVPGRISPRGVAAVAALTGAGLYAALAGFALPTQRALAMVAAGLFAVVAMRDFAPSRVLAMAAIGVVLWQPDAVIAPGFWLSFGAVAWIIYLAPFRGRSQVVGLARLQIGLVAGLMPLTFLWFGQGSLVAPVVNALLIPLAGLLVPLLLLLTFLTLAWPVLGTPLLTGVAHLMALGWPALVAIADWPLAQLDIAAVGPWAAGLALIGMAWLMAPSGLPGRWTGFVLLLPAVIGWLPASGTMSPGHYRLTVLDVGQGLAVVVRTANHTLLFDTGPAFRTGFDAGEAIVVPYMRHIRRTRIDKLVISHGDLDHAGGAAAVVKALTVEQGLGAGSNNPCWAGQHWRWDGVDFSFLYPTPRDIARATNRNAHSCVLRIASAAGSTLLTGDLEASGEQRLVERHARAIDVDVLMVGHHGSVSSSSPAFVAAVSPRHALISAGWHNRWGFPVPEVVSRLDKAGAALANTADSGALDIRVTGPHDHVVVRRWRRTHARFWQNP